jgi:DNA repair ATPase RecN
MKVKISGFQIIEEAEFTVEGLTFFTGKSNSGKTSVTKAIEGALFNSPGSDFINESVGKSTVEILFPAEEGYPELSLIWEKSPKSAKFIVNGELYQKTGRSNPTDILNQHGIKEIETARQKHRLNFCRQFDSLFLVADTPSFVFEFISKISEERKVIPVLRFVGEEIKKDKEDAVRIEGAINSLQAQGIEKRAELESLPDIAALQPKVLALTASRTKLSRLLEVCSKLVEADRGIKGVVEEMGTLPDLSPIREKIKGLGVLLDRQRKLNSALGSIQSTSGSILLVDESLDKLSSVREAARKLNKIKVDKLKSLRELYRNIQSSEENISLTLHQIHEEGKELSRIQIEFKEFKDKIQVCPVCNSSLKKEHSHG